MRTYYATAWTEDGPLADQLETRAENIGAAAAQFYRDTDHVNVVELNIWREDR